MKRKLITMMRIFRGGLKNFFRNAWLSVAATAIMMVALTIVLLSVVISTTAKNAINELSENLKISVYLKDGAFETTTNDLKKALTTHYNVKNVEYVSKQEAQERFNRTLSGNEKLLQGIALVGGDIQPASFEISVKDLSKMEEAGAIAKQKEFESVVDSVSLGKTDSSGNPDARKAIDRAAAVQKYIVIAGIVAATTFGLVSALIIFNTIRMAVFTRSEEIEIMKLIGATPNYIRGPFIVEASIYGIIAGVVAFAAVYALILSLGIKVATQPEFASSYELFTDPLIMTIIFISMLFGGVLIGFVSSMLAMERYLRLKYW